ARSAGRAATCTGFATRPGGLASRCADVHLESPFPLYVLVIDDRFRDQVCGPPGRVSVPEPAPAPTGRSGSRRTTRDPAEATPAATRNTSLIARDMAFSTAARSVAGKPCTAAGWPAVSWR